MSADSLQFYGKDIGLNEKNADLYITLSFHPGGEGIDLANELNGKLGPVFAGIRDASSKVFAGSPEEIESARASAVNQQIAGVFNLMPGSEFGKLARRLLKYVRIARKLDNGESKIFDLGKEVDYDAFFRRNYGALMPLVMKVIHESGFTELDVSEILMGNPTASEATA